MTRMQFQSNQTRIKYIKDKRETQRETERKRNISNRIDEEKR